MFKELELSFSDSDEDERVADMEKGKSQPSAILRAAVNELERALADTKRILSERDNTISRLRGEIAEQQHLLDSGVEEINKMESALTTTKASLTQNGLKLEELQKENMILRKAIDEARHDVKVQASSSNEEVKLLRTALLRERKSLAIPLPARGTVTTEKAVQAHLRMRFLRDAFFYYMIDFHSDEQIKAILAILEYEDKRQDLVCEAHRMRKSGRKFTANEVSSRCLTFVQEEIR